MRVLLIEDDPILGDGIRSGLRQTGFAVDWCVSGESAPGAIGAQHYAVIILDIGLPGISGLQLLAGLRSAGDRTPTLLLTARDTVRDRVVGLNAGADDYLVKPFDLEELRARVRALGRRAIGQPGTRLEFGDVLIDSTARTCQKQQRTIDLPRREFTVLLILAEHAGQVISRERIAEALYAWDDNIESNAIEVHIHHLRRKLGRDLIRTVRGSGYIIDRNPP